MAQYLAEMIKAAEGDETLKPRCAELIMQLWEKRRTFAHGDPLGQYDRLIEPLEAILRTDTGRFPTPRGPTGAPKEADAWMRLARQVDKASTTLIAFCIRAAAQSITPPDEELLEAADLVESGPQNKYVRLIRAVGGLDEIQPVPKPDEVLSEAEKELEIALENIRAKAFPTPD